MGAERLVVDLLLWLSYAIQVHRMDTYAIVASVLLQVITGFLGSSHPVWTLWHAPPLPRFCHHAIHAMCFLHLLPLLYYEYYAKCSFLLLLPSWQHEVLWVCARARWHDERPPAECLCAEVKIRTNCNKGNLVLEIASWKLKLSRTAINWWVDWVVAKQGCCLCLFRPAVYRRSCSMMADHRFWQCICTFFN